MSKFLFVLNRRLVFFLGEESQHWLEYLNVIDQLLTENDIDTTSCMQRMVCWAVRNSAQNVVMGRSSSSDKIIDGLATNKWVQQLIEGTTVHSALQNGLSRTDCSREYHQCRISETSIQMLTRKFTENISALRN
ncbi:hypothetical protein Zmor_021292 [Zophobas morio]|uniref:Uncharacterized protein n=1 Tax=Zophobas morio TaxID=2755281 RepID=A0AA38I7D0_9CUCU|nr:hypothetical protein Zmor_021292 [Zophobas morio]